MTPDLSRKQLVRNLGSNLAGFGLGLLSNIVLTPYWITHLGVAAYGLVPLTNSLVAYLGVIAAVLSSSVSRFVMIEVSRGDLARANRVFNTSLWGSVAVAVAALAVGGAASAHIDHLIAVPEGFRGDAILMFALGSVAFVVSVLQTPFGAATYAANRIDLNNWSGVAMRIVQIAVGVGLVSTVYARPAALMLASLAGCIVGAAAAVWYWRQYMPWCRIAWLVDRDVLRAQLAFGGWAVINLIGALLYLQIDLLVANRMLGPLVAGQYAALGQWSLLIRGLGGSLGTILGPSVTHYYARNEMEPLVQYVQRSVLAVGLFLALPIGIVSGLARPLLTSWLGAAYSHFDWLLLLMVLPLSVNVAVTPLFILQGAANRVRTPALVTLVMGAANLALAVVLTRPLGLYGIAAAGAVMLTAKNVIFTPIYTARALGCRWDVFFREIAKAALLACVVAGCGLAISHSVSVDSWPRIAVASLALGVVYVPLVWLGALTSAERRVLKEQVFAPVAARLAIW